jgi:hypothetical protein
MMLANGEDNDNQEESSSLCVFPDLPLVCLRTANDLTTHQLLKGRNVVIGKHHHLFLLRVKKKFIYFSIHAITSTLHAHRLVLLSLFYILYSWKTFGRLVVHDAQKPWIDSTA